MSFLLTPANILLEDKWMFLRHPIKQGDRVKINGAEVAGTVTGVLPDNCFEVVVAFDDGPTGRYQVNQLTRVAQ